MKRKKTVQIGIKIDETTRRSLEEAAKGTRLGISTLVRLGIEKVLKEWNERKCVLWEGRMGGRTEFVIKLRGAAYLMCRPDFPETLTSYSSINAAKLGAERLAKRMREIFEEDGK